jgi:glycosyltransferase involved in cell wall biosynthesis
VSKNILLVVDNLRLGGIQRLVLDEGYCFQDLGFSPYILTLNHTPIEKSILNSDFPFFQTRPIPILVSPKGLFTSFIFLIRTILSIKPNLVMCHAAQFNVLLRVARVLLRSNFRIHAFIHQLPTLSSFRQNLKHSIYYRFADQFSAVSVQFKQEIVRLRREKFVYRVMYDPNIGFDRIGIYLPRLKQLQLTTKFSTSDLDRPLLFLGRIIGWKGFHTFCQIANEDFPRRGVVVITSPEIHQTAYEPDFFGYDWRRIYFSIGVGSINWTNSAIHIYPSNYGEETQFPMAIGLNVLECLALGIPSIISQDNFVGWPELKGSILCVTTDWSRQDVIEKIKMLSSIKLSSLERESTRLSRILSIEDYCLRNLIKSKLVLTF